MTIENTIQLNNIFKSINTDKYFLSGSNNTTTGSISANTNVLIVNDIIDFEADQGICIFGAGQYGIGVKHKEQITITSGAIKNGRFNIRLNTVDRYVEVLAGETPEQIAQKIKNNESDYDEWTLTLSGASVSFEAKTVGERLNGSFSYLLLNPHWPFHGNAPMRIGDTGVRATLTVVTQGQNQYIVTKITNILGNKIYLKDNVSTTVTNAVIEHDDTEALRSLLVSKTNVELGNKTYNTSSTISLGNNTKLVGTSKGYWGDGGTIVRFKGTGAAFNFIDHFTHGTTLRDFVVKAYDKYKSNGIEINAGEDFYIKSVSVSYCNIGLLINGRTEFIKTGSIECITADHNTNEGIYFVADAYEDNLASLVITTRFIQMNKIGLRLNGGDANHVYGNGSEMHNVKKNIWVEGGEWIFSGVLYNENYAGEGIENWRIDGGHVKFDVQDVNTQTLMFFGDRANIYTSNPLLYNMNPKTLENLKPNIKLWLSCNEGRGQYIYDYINKKEYAVLSNRAAWEANSQYNGMVLTSNADIDTYSPLLQLNGIIDWESDWTLLFLGRGKKKSTTFNTLIKFDGGKSILINSGGISTNLSGAWITPFTANTDMIYNVNWNIISYDSKNKLLFGIRQNGYSDSCYSFTFPHDSAIGDIDFAPYPIGIDEFVLVNKLLNAQEVRLITNASYTEDPKIITGFTTLPTPNVSMRGKTCVLEKGVGANDETYLCVKNSDETYSWRNQDFTSLIANLDMYDVINTLGNYGNFVTDTNSDGLADGLTLQGAVSAKSISNNEQHITVSAQYSGFRISGLTNAVGDIVYTCAYISADTTSINLNISDTITYKTGKPRTLSSGYEFLSTMYIAAKGDTSLNPVISDNRASGWTEIIVKQMYFINLTACFGAGNEPTKTFMDNIMQKRIAKGYFTSTTIIK